MMTIKTSKEQNTLAVTVEGRLDTTTAPQLEELLKSTEDTTALILDFEKLEYISSAGLRVLLSAQKKMNQREGMKILHVNDSVMEVFDITGFLDILVIE